jgi:hypothetical protein
MRVMPSRSTIGTPGTGLLRLYPSWWRERYGSEVADLLEARPLDVRARLDLVRGAFDAHIGNPEPERGPRRAVAAALIAGATWTITGVASVGGPVPPDWPGYLDSTLPVAVIGVVAILIASIGVARIAWSSSSPSLELVVLASVLGHVAWAAVLVVAALGGPYGAVTAIAQTAAAIATVGIGLALIRADAHPIGEAVVVAGAVLLLPTPVAWLIAGAFWTGIGLWQAVAARSDDEPRVMLR